MKKTILASLGFAVAALALAISQPFNKDINAAEVEKAPIVTVSTGNIGADGYIFLQKQKINLAPKMRFVIYPSYEALREEAVKRKLGHNTAAFTEQPNKENKQTCTIHMVEPEYDYRPQLAGHELFHCMYGQWHVYNW